MGVSERVRTIPKPAAIAFYLVQEVPVASTEGRKSDRPDQSRSTCTLTERSSSRKATGLSPRRLQLDPWGECQVPPCTPASALGGSQGFTCTTTRVIKAAIEIEKGSQMAKPGTHGKDKQRCGARVRHRAGFCRNWPVPGKTRCRFHGGCSTGALTDEGKARSLAAMRAGRQRWHEEMRAKKASGEIERFPGGRKAGPRWVTPRMRELREIEAIRRVQDARDALRPPSAPPPRRGRPTIIARAQAQIARALAQSPEHSPWLASLAPQHLARVAEARRDLERRAHRARPRPDL